MIYRTMLYRTMLYRTMLYRTMLYRTMLYRTIINLTVRYSLHLLNHTVLLLGEFLLMSSGFDTLRQLGYPVLSLGHAAR
jgi:hypothetical protein